MGGALTWQRRENGSNERLANVTLTESKTLPAGDYQIIANQRGGNIRLRNIRNNTQISFPAGWQAEGLRRLVQFPRDSEELLRVSHDVLVEKPLNPRPVPVTA